MRDWIRALTCLVTPLLAGTWGAGCVLPNSPPTMSLSRFVRDPEPPRPPSAPDGAAKPARTRGKVGVSSGVAFILQKQQEPEAQPMEGQFYFFPVEGALSLLLGSHYDLAVGVNSNYLLEVSGNVALYAGRRFRLGLLHGVGVGLYGCARNCEDEDDDTGWGGLLMYTLSAGLMAQFTVGRGVLFFGARYSYASHAELGDASDDSKDNRTHYVTASLGVQLRVGWLRITPELVFSYGYAEYTETYDEPHVAQRSNTYIIVPSVTFAAGF